MKLEVTERNPGIIDCIEFVSDTGDRFEMAVLKHLINHELILLPNSAGAYSIFAIPTFPRIAKRLGKMKSAYAHLDDASKYNRNIPKQ